MFKNKINDNKYINGKSKLTLFYTVKVQKGEKMVIVIVIVLFFNKKCMVI